MKKIIVCGAGIGGLVSAIYLSHKGYEVEIFEKDLKPGGKLNEFSKEGFRFDTGPSSITLPEILKKFFKDTERNINDYIELVELENSCRYFWQDGTVFNSYSDEVLLENELLNVFGENSRINYFGFMKYGKLFYDLSEENFIKSEFKLKNYITREGLKNITKFISGRSLNDVSNKFFSKQKLKQIMNNSAAYNGSSPFLAPQFLSIIPYVEFKFGSWYVKGGIYRIIKALEKICNEMNIRINYCKELTGIDGINRTITKLEFKNYQQEIQEVTGFDNLISNFTNDKKLTGDEYFKNDDWSSSGFIMMMGITKEFKELSHNNVLFPEDHEKEFIDIFEKKIPADDMTITLSISKKNETSDAPNDCENWLVQVNAPAISDNFEWTEKNTEIYKNKILDKIDSSHFIKDGSIRDHIKFCEVLTPVDLMNKYNSEFGSIYGLSSNSIYTLIKRPKNKSKIYDNLYFVGGNTFPGGGVPMCFLSGKIVSELV